MKHIALIPICLTLALLSACGTGGKYTGSNYSGSEARRIERIRMATITALAPASIKDQESGVGALIGLAAGAIAAGSGIGSGNGAILAGIGGGILGAAAGSAIENSANSTNGIRISLKLDNGELIAITQELDSASQALRIGDRVQILGGANGINRVSK